MRSPRGIAFGSSKIPGSVRPVILLGLAALLALSHPVSADWLVYKDGTRIQTDGPWRIEGKLAVFSLPNGVLSTVKAEELDFAASRELTRALGKDSLTRHPVRKPETPRLERFMRVRARPCLNRRRLPDSHQAPLDCIPYGTRLQKLREGGDFTRVRTPDGRVGWAASDYLAAEASSGRRVYPSMAVQAKPCLNRRLTPAADSPARDCVPFGTIVEILGGVGTWSHVRTPSGFRGWMASEFLATASEDGRLKSALVLTDADVGHVDSARFEPSSDIDSDAQKSDLVVIRWGRSEPGDNGILIVGHLRNESNRASTAVEVKVRALGHSEETLFEQPAVLEKTTLMPDQVTRFELLLSQVFSFQEIEFETSSIALEVADAKSTPPS